MQCFAVHFFSPHVTLQRFESISQGLEFSSERLYLIVFLSLLGLQVVCSLDLLSHARFLLPESLVFLQQLFLQPLDRFDVLFCLVVGHQRLAFTFGLL